MLTEAAEELIGDARRVACHRFGEFEGYALARRKCGELPRLERLQLRFRRSLPPCQGGMRVESILAAVQVRDADGHHFLELLRDRARVHHRAEVRWHGSHD